MYVYSIRGGRSTAISLSVMLRLFLYSAESQLNQSLPIDYLIGLIKSIDYLIGLCKST